MTETGGTNSDRAISGAELRLDNVVKRYPGQKVAAVDSLSLTVPAGEIVTFVGPSGCGKTTSLKMINRLIEPTSGTILIDDQDIRSDSATSLRRKIGYVIQGGSLFPHMTVATNVGVVPRCSAGTPRRSVPVSMSSSTWSASTPTATATATRASSPGASSSASALPEDWPPTHR